ncbi:hypothetical protein LINPERPRIM_LOCUS16821 [Linum perenne]
MFNSAPSSRMELSRVFYAIEIKIQKQTATVYNMAESIEKCIQTARSGEPGDPRERGFLNNKGSATNAMPIMVARLAEASQWWSTTAANGASFSNQNF